MEHVTHGITLDGVARFVDIATDALSAAREEIEAAAREVGSQRTVEAMAAVEQHALDVCGTPLSR